MNVKWNLQMTRLDLTRLVIFLFFFLFVILPLSGCQPSNTSLDKSDKSKIEFQGYVEGELSYMAVPFAGDLKVLSKQRGELVKKGDLLFILEKEPQSMQAIGAENGIIQAQSRLQLAILRLHRSQELYKDKAIQKDALDAALDERNRSQALLEEAKQKSAQSNWDLTQKTGIAPVAGVVDDTYFTKGEWVPAGAPVLSLLAPENIHIIFFIPEKMVSQVKLQDHVMVTINHKKYHAKIEYISPQVEFTPPVIFSRDNDVPLVFRIRARPVLSQAYDFHPGQPVNVQFLES